MSGIWITWISSEGWRHSKQKHQSQAPAEHFCSRAEKIHDIHKRLERTRLPFLSLFLTQSAILLNNVSPGSEDLWGLSADHVVTWAGSPLFIHMPSVVDLDGHSLPQSTDPPLRGLLHQDQYKYNNLPYSQKSHRLQDLAPFVMSQSTASPKCTLLHLFLSGWVSSGWPIFIPGSKDK